MMCLLRLLIWWFGGRAGDEIVLRPAQEIGELSHCRYSIALALFLS